MRALGAAARRVRGARAARLAPTSPPRPRELLTRGDGEAAVPAVHGAEEQVRLELAFVHGLLAHVAGHAAKGEVAVPLPRLLPPLAASMLALAPLGSPLVSRLLLAVPRSLAAALRRTGLGGRVVDAPPLGRG